MFKILIVLFAAVLGLEAFQLLTEDTSFTSSVANLLVKHNLHEVVPGKFYRSGEMVPSELADVVKSNGIKTVIDLRYGVEEPGSKYFGESEAAQQSGAEYVHFPLLGSRIVSPERLKELLDLLDRAQTPVLVHCSSGSHRSSLVSSIWLLEHEHATPAEAQAQFSRKYGFFLAERKLKSWMQGYPTIDQVLWDYLQNGAGKGFTFRQWVESGLPQSGSQDQSHAQFQAPS